MDRACAQSYKAGSRSQLREALPTGLPRMFFAASMHWQTVRKELVGQFPDSNVVPSPAPRLFLLEFLPF